MQFINHHKPFGTIMQPHTEKAREAEGEEKSVPQCKVMQLQPARAPAEFND